MVAGTGKLNLYYSVEYAPGMEWLSGWHMVCIVSRSATIVCVPVWFFGSCVVCGHQHDGINWRNFVLFALWCTYPRPVFQAIFFVEGTKRAAGAQVRMKCVCKSSTFVEPGAPPHTTWFGRDVRSQNQAGIAGGGGGCCNAAQRPKIPPSVQVFFAVF